METVCFCSELFFWRWKPLLKLGGTNFKRKNHFLWFFFHQKKQFFHIVETYFSWNASFRLVKTDFLARTNHFFSCRQKLFFLSSGNVFLSESFIPPIGKGFFSLMETVTLPGSFFLLEETVTAMSGNQFLKTELILAGENWLSGYFLPLFCMFFRESVIPISGNAFFCPKE